MPELLSFLILISAGLFLSEIFRLMHLPYVVALIIAGIIIGPNGAGVFEIDPVIEFLGSIGLIFLMFMAGLEIRLSGFEKIKKEASKLSMINGLIPFATGFLIASYFGYSQVASILLGIIFISSSIAVVIPSLEANGLLNLKLGKTIVGATVLEDVFSLILFSIVLQTINPTTTMPLSVFYILIFTSMIGLKSIIPKLREYYFIKTKSQKHLFEQDLRLIFVILIGTVVFFDMLGMHAIIAGFFTGLVLSESIQSEILKKKLHALSYGIFIPAFFIIIGGQMDLTIFTKAGDALLLTVFVVVGSIGAKVISGWIGGRAVGFDSNQSKLIGVATIPQLSTTLAVAYTGLELGILDEQIITAMIALSVVTTIIGPLMIAKIAKIQQPAPKKPQRKLASYMKHG